MSDTPPDKRPTLAEYALAARGGVTCPMCGCTQMVVVYTRHWGRKTVRVRECRKCKHRVRTHEEIADTRTD